MLAGDGEDGFALGIAGDLDNCLACVNDLARVGLGYRHYALVRRNEFGVVQLVLRNAKIGFGRLHLGLGALKSLERVLIECSGGPAFLEQDAVALFLRRSLGDSGVGGGEVGPRRRSPDSGNRRR